jgi:hypothetical protein
MHSFIVESGKLRISDPCYSLDMWCAGTVDSGQCGVFNEE